MPLEPMPPALPAPLPGQCHIDMPQRLGSMFFFPTLSPYGFLLIVQRPDMPVNQEI